jgi:hypothetical protein
MNAVAFVAVVMMFLLELVAACGGCPILLM